MSNVQLRVRNTLILLLACVTGLSAQQGQPAAPVPRLVRISNTFHPANGLPAAQVESVSLSIYREESGGTPLWQETQNVNIDAEGRYTALLGSTLNDGMPLDLFTSAEPRWLGVQFNRPGETEQPRVQLVSVPYALKASDAETLGGVPAAAYLRAPTGDGAPVVVESTAATPSSSPESKALKPRAITGTPIPNSIVKFTDSGGDIGNSILTDTGSLAVAGQAAMGSGHATQTFGFDLYVNGNNPAALIDAVANPGTASLFLQGRSGTASNHQLSVNSGGLFSITPSGTGFPAFAINQSGVLMSGTLNPWAGAKLQVRTGTNQNLAVAGPQSIPNGITLHSFNDAVSANVGLEVRGAPIVFSVGNVGIGTAAPGSKLDVVGNMNLSGNLSLGGTLSYGGVQMMPPLIQFIGSNAGLGAFALQNNTVNGLYNTAVGYQALYQNTSGTNNTAVGFVALDSNTGGNNTALGSQALSTNMTGGNNTATGYAALTNNTTGSYNTATGMQALYSNVNGGSNTATGLGALYSNTSGSSNTATGYGALYYNTSGNYNTATGQGALSSNTGNNNTAAGYAALLFNNGNNNSAMGYNALEGNTNGNNNTAIGYNALEMNTVGQNNTAVGINALAGNVNGNNNIAVGQSAGQFVASGNSDNIHIGTGGQAGDNGTIRVGNFGTQSSFFAAGIGPCGTCTVEVVIDPNTGQLGKLSSSRRFKEDIHDMGDASSGLLRLRPVTFRYKEPFADGSKPIQYGLIAEEVAEVYPDLVVHSPDGQIETVKYQLLDSMLLNEVQLQQKEISSQRARIGTQDGQIRNLQQQIDELKALIATPSGGSK